MENGKRLYSTYGTSRVSAGVIWNLSAAAACISDILTTKCTRSLYCLFRILRACRSSSAEVVSISTSSPGTGGGDLGMGGRDGILMGTVSGGGPVALTTEGTDGCLLMDKECSSNQKK